MTDICVTVPQSRWQEWIQEGALPGEPCPLGVEYHWFSSAVIPQIQPGERVYIVAFGLLRGYAPLVRLERRPVLPPSWWWPQATWALVRHGGAVSCTIPATIKSMPGWRYRWWQRYDERTFPDWKTNGITSLSLSSRQGVHDSTRSN